MSELREFEPDLFTLEDEEGNEQTFELCDVYKEGDTTYFALIPQQLEDSSDEEDYFVILKRDDNDPDEYLDSIDDEEELDRLAEIFMQRILEDVEDEHECHDENCDCCH
ncbi:MAG: DUF1292 domain-containing protein [Oscillospiraceae bacterium]|nr:DUF1292 domain-containing protein [Oscillospiraceae bacterium]